MAPEYIKTNLLFTVKESKTPTQYRRVNEVFGEKSSHTKIKYAMKELPLIDSPDKINLNFSEFISFVADVFFLKLIDTFFNN